MSNTDFDLVIVGAGPAGCTTALALAGSGLKIAIVDRSRLPSAKVCGDALSGTVMNVLKRLPGSCYDDFLKVEEKSPSWGIRFTAPGGRSLDLPFSGDPAGPLPAPGFLCRRRIFDAFLQQKVLDTGSATLMDQFPVRHILRKKEDILIRSENETMTCRMVVGADGVHSLVRKMLSGHQPDEDKYSLGIRAYFRGVKEIHPQKFLELHFLKELLPGYFWIFPMESDRVNAGLGVPRRMLHKGKDSLLQRFREIIASHPSISCRFKDAEMVSRPEVHGLRSGPDPYPVSGEGFVLAGDAASLTDPFTGEGVGNAMISGEIAAKIIREAFLKNDFSESFLGSYDPLIRARLGRELKTSRIMQRLITLPGLFDLVVKKAVKNEDVKAVLTKMYTDTEARDRLKDPLFYLKLLLS